MTSGAPRDPGGLQLALMYGVLSGVLLLALGVGVVLVAFASDLPVLDGADGLPGWLVTLALVPQLVGMVALVPLAHALTDRTWYGPRGVSGRPAGWRGVFALWRPSPAALGWGLGIGLVVGVFPGFLATWLQEVFPGSGEGLDLIGSLLTDGGLGWRVLAGVLIAVGAPVVEELVFRGFLWDAVGRFATAPVTWGVTSVVFALYHTDPVHVVAVLPTAFVLGWLRWATGSVGPGMLAHAVNNAIAVGAAWWAPDAAPSGLVVAGCLVATGAGCVGVAGAGGRRPW